MEKQYFQSANVFIHHNTIDVKMTFCGGENDLKKKKNNFSVMENIGYTVAGNIEYCVTI